MGTITVHAGDFPLADKGLSAFDGTYFAFPLPDGEWGKQKVSFKDLVSLEVVTEQTVGRGMGPVGRGLVGLTLAGPAGLLLGAVSAKSGNNITFIAKFQDGRELLGTCEQETFVSMKAALIDRDRRPRPQPSLSFEQRIDRWKEGVDARMAARLERLDQKRRDLEQKSRDQGYSDEQIAARRRRRKRILAAVVIVSLLVILVTSVLPKHPEADATGIESTSTGQTAVALPTSIDRQAWTSEAVALFRDDHPDAKITNAWAVKSENLVWVCAVGSSQFIAQSRVSDPKGAADFHFVKDDLGNLWHKLCREPGRNDMPSAQSKPNVGTGSETFARQLVERYYGAVGGVWTSSQGIVCGRLEDGHRWWILEPSSTARDAIVMEGTAEEGSFHGQYGSWALYCS